MKDEQKQQASVPARQQVTALAGRGLQPRTFDELVRMSKILSASGLMPKGCDTAEQVFTAIQMGMEVGLPCMAAVQNVAVINGRPSLFGDALLAIVQDSGLLEDFHEEPMRDEHGRVHGFQCSAKRRGRSQPIVRQFTVDDAKRAGLWDIKGPWKQYPKRMLQMRARAWCLRDGFADVLKGMRAAEEQSDIPVEAGESMLESTDAPATEADRLAEALDRTPTKPPEPDDEPEETGKGESEPEPKPKAKAKAKMKRCTMCGKRVPEGDIVTHESGTPLCPACAADDLDNGSEDAQA